MGDYLLSFLFGRKYFWMEVYKEGKNDRLIIGPLSFCFVVVFLIIIFYELLFMFVINKYSAINKVKIYLYF